MLTPKGAVRPELKAKMEERLLALSDRPDVPQAYRELVYRTLPGARTCVYPLNPLRSDGKRVSCEMHAAAAA